LSQAPTAHPSSRLLDQHASGWLEWPPDLCVRVHLESCAECRAFVAAREVEAFDFVDDLPEAPMAPAALAALVARLEATPPALSSGTPRSLGDVRLPRALSGLSVAGRRWLKPGLWLAHVSGAGRAQPPDDWRTYLLRAPPGLRLPTHGHRGPEYICVLSGVILNGEAFHSGDFIETAAAVEHAMVVGPDEPCACLVAAKGRLSWRGAARLLNPLLSV
jgi:putative transcriptional regulator